MVNPVSGSSACRESRVWPPPRLAALALAVIPRLVRGNAKEPGLKLVRPSNESRFRITARNVSWQISSTSSRVRSADS